MPLKRLTPHDQAMAVVGGATTGVQSAASSRRSSNTGLDELVEEKLPVSAYYIILVEGCERFCFSGLRVILLLYFMHYFHMKQNTATAYYHTFSCVYHLTPVFGAILSDGYIGRYLTILILSTVYSIGTLILTLTAIPDIGHRQLFGPALGLLFIALGSGGIKPCVNAFGADQVHLSNKEQLSKLFSFFYFAIQIGSLVSTIVTPLLRSEVQCFGYDCYSLAFGVSSSLMFFSTILFMLGTPLYKRIPSKENIIAKFLAIIWRTIRNFTCSKTSESKEHWLYYADDKYTRNDIEDVRTVFHIFVLLLPLSVYHALHSQKGSRWTYQASLMNGSLGPFGTLQPDQIQVLSSILVLLFIPLFERVIYPAAARFNWLIEPLQRMFLGLLLTILAFIVAALLQQAIIAKEDAIPVRHYTNIYSDYHCPLNIFSRGTLEPGHIHALPCELLLHNDFLITSVCDGKVVDYKLEEDKVCPSVMVVSERINTENITNMTLTVLTNPSSKNRGVQEYALLRLVSLDDAENTTVSIVPNQYVFNIEKKLVPTEYQSVHEAKYQVGEISTGQRSSNSFRVQTTAVYTVLLANTSNNEAILFEDVPPFTVHVLWQTLQYIVLTTSEVLVSITALIFAYAEAPRHYKVVIISVWYLTSALGDVLVVFISEVELAKNQTVEFILYAIMMAFATFIFGVIAINYKQKRSFQPVDDPTEDDYLLTNRNSSH